MSETSLSLDRYLGLCRVSAIECAPSGEWAAVAVSRLDPDKAKFVSDLWRVSLVGDEAPVRLTRGRYNDRAPCFRKDGALGFLSNRPPREGKPEEGDEDFSQVWILPAEGGEPLPLTDEPLGVSAFRFAERGDRLLLVTDVFLGIPHEEQRKYFLDRKKNGPSALHYTTMPVRFWDSWLSPAAPHLISYTMDGRERKDLTPEADRAHREASWAISPDGKQAAITLHTPGADRVEEHRVLLFDLESGTQKVLPAPPLSMIGSLCFSPDGSLLACTMHTRSRHRFGKQMLWLYDLAKGEGRELCPDWDAWPNPASFTPDGAALIVSVDEKGRVPVYRVDVSSGEHTRLSSVSAGGTHESLRVTSRGQVVGLRHCFFHPPEPFCLTPTPDSEPRILASLSGFSRQDGEAIATREDFYVPAPDGGEVHAFLLSPRKKAQEKRPTLFWIHGGPVGHFGDGWHWRWNPLLAVSEGFHVVLSNPRGSTGYGQEFVEGIWGNEWGAACYRDLMAVADALAEKPACDTSRLAAMGGSFGGYMTNWIGGNTDRFRCLVSHAGLYSFSHFHGVTDCPAWFALEMGISPYEDAEAFEKYSPHRRIGSWKTPTLVIHGEKDYRVPIGEALALFEGLQLHGVPSELLAFPDEGHWIMRPRNIKVWYETIFSFLKKHLA